jgi:1-acyl-sn-glycerol-3-phosphate acyltransferase
MTASVPTSHSSSDPDAAESLLAVVRDVIAEIRPGQAMMQPLSLDNSLDRELGLDSLTRMQLVARIERRFGVRLPERLLVEAETPRDFLRAVLSATPQLEPEPGETITRLVLGEAQAAPYSAETLIDVLDWHIEQHPDRPHIRLYSDQEEGETLTYRQLKEGAVKVASGLQYHGVQRGQAIAVMLPTGAEYFFSFVGILLAGCVPVPIYPPARPAHLEDHLRRHAGILANCLAPVLITPPEGKALARLLRAHVETLQQVVSVEELAGLPGSWLPPPVSAGDTAFLQYTSGSTGNPKGVILSHANLLANIRAMGTVVRASADDVFVSWLPLYHDMGLIGAWLGSLYYAFPLVIMPPLSFLSRPQRWLWAIHRYRGTLSASPNFGYETCLRRLEDRDIQGLDLSSWRIAFNGAEAVSPETVTRFMQRFSSYGFKRESLMPVYGLAESTVGLAFPPLGREPLVDLVQREVFARSGRASPAVATDKTPLRFTACGLPLPGHQTRVVDAADRELPERQQGHIHFRGPSATSGYFRDHSGTQALFHGNWLDTGDLGYIAGGELYVTGRSKDIIIRAGRNIYPHEVEQAIGQIEGIRKGCVAVFGSTDATAGTERLIVLAETREQAPSRLEELRAQTNAVVTDLIGAPPDEVMLSPPGTVLKTSSGKIRRTATRELYDRGEIGKPQRAVWRQIAGLALEGVLPMLRRIGQRTAEWLFAGYAWSVFGLLAPIVWASVMILPSLVWRWRIVRSAIRLLRWATRTPLTVQGLENLPPAGTAFALVSNHASYLDAYVLIAAIPRHLGFVAKAELERDPLLGRALVRIGTEFVERFEVEKGVGDARRLARILKQGRSLVFFAEGTFTRMPGLQSFHLGAFTAAAEAGAPVVPVALRGTRSILRGESAFPRHGEVHVTIGKPIEPASAAPAGDSWQAALTLRNAARDHILRHCGEPDLGYEKPSLPKAPAASKADRTRT